jgi:hypothetical protein
VLSRESDYTTNQVTKSALINFHVLGRTLSWYPSLKACFQQTNHVNFSAVSNLFPDNAVLDPVTGLTQSAVVPTPEGTVGLLNGPYRYHGFVRTSASQLSTPLAFASAKPPNRPLQQSK